MSSDDIEFASSSSNNTGEVMQDNTDDTIKDDDQTSPSQQALKQLSQLNELTKVNKLTTATVIPSTSTITTANLQKIEPKLTLPGTAKIVYIKNGTQQSIRIGNSAVISGNQTVSANNSTNNAISSTSAIQKVQLLQLKNKNVVGSTVPASTNSPRIVLKSGNASPKFIISSSGAATKISTAPGSSNTRTITVSQAQQMGLIVSSNKTNTSTASTSSSTTTKTLILPASSTSATSNIALKNQPTILNKGVKTTLQTSKILIQSDGSGDNETKLKTTTSAVPNIVKMAGTGQPVRVLQGKQLQYVRVLNAIPSGNSNTTTTSKIVNGRQQQVIVQRKIAPQPSGTQITTTGKPQQFVTKKLEVMPIGSTTKLIKKEPTTQTVKPPTTYLLNNVQKKLVTSSIDIKPVISNQSDSFEITETKDEPLSPSAPKKFATNRTYSQSTDRKSKSPEPIQSNLMYSTLKLPSPEPIEGKYLQK